MSITIKEGVPGDIVIPSSVRMSDDEFYEFAAGFPDIQIERDKHGNIFIMPPTSFDTGNFESEAIGELILWNRTTKAGMVFSSQTGFVLPNNAMRGPDASWISNERVAQLPQEERNRFARICPDFVLEIRSRSETLSSLRKKMEEYIENGARLGFLIDPPAQLAFVYHANGSVSHVQDFDGALSGEVVLPGFSLPLSLFKPQP